MKVPRHFVRILKKIYGLPASITIVTGLWKSGKTDFSLLISEICQDLGIIDRIASNVETGDPRVAWIKSLSRLKLWFFRETGRKMYLYDEVIESTPRRRAMSSLNVEWVKTIPQLSKARGHIIAITQEEKLTESAFFNPTFCRGIWRKVGLKSVELNSPSLLPEPYKTWGIPPTSINFDPYRLATFQIVERSMFSDKLPVELKTMLLYARPKTTFEGVAKELGLSQATEVRRLLKRGCRIFLTFLQQPSEGEGIIKASKKLEQDHV